MLVARWCRDGEARRFYQTIETQVQNDAPSSRSGGVEDGGLAARYAAWLIVEGTSVSYPVVAARDAAEVDYYLSHLIDGTYSPTGSLVIDERSSANAAHIMVYGHCVGRTDQMFGSLREAHLPEVFDTLGPACWRTRKGEEVFHPLCAFTVNASDGTFQRFGDLSADEVATLAYEMASRAQAREARWRDHVKRAERLLTLVTCTTARTGETERTVVVFRAGNDT